MGSEENQLFYFFATITRFNIKDFFTNKLVISSILPHKGSKLKLADWPLCSKANPLQNSRQYITNNSYYSQLVILPTPGRLGKSKFSKPCKLAPKKESLLAGKDTRTIQISSQFSTTEISVNHDSSDNHICDTCKEVIPEISRILIMRDRDGGPRVLFYHFFFPCWDMKLLCQQYPNLVIDKIGFTIPEEIQMKENSIKDLQENLDWWN